MKSRQIDQSLKTFILVFETGDELAKGLLEFVLIRFTDYSLI
jgi:hypothetical protein